MQIALHTHLADGAAGPYEQAHREVPAELVAAIRSAGASSWTIWRSGRDLFHVIECESYPRLLAALERAPANVAWQARIAPLLDVAHDYSNDGAAATLPVAWALPPAMTAMPALSPLGFGGAAIGGLYDAVDEAEAVQTVRCALDVGQRYLDTAPHYGLGDSERRIGQALAGVNRDSYVLSTKVGRVLVPLDACEQVPDEGFATTQPLKRVWDFSRDGIRRSLEASLQRLGLDRVDILYLHDPDDHEREVYDTAFAALDELRTEGMVTAIGAGMNQAEMLTRFVRRLDFDVVLVAGRYSLLDQSAASELLPVCRQRGIEVVVGGAFNGGLLAHPRPGAAFDYRPAPPELLQQARALADVCDRHGADLVSAALQFPLAEAAVSSVLVGARSPNEVAANQRAFARPVPSDVWEEMRATGLLPAHVTTPAGADDDGRALEVNADPGSPPPRIVDAHHHLWDPGARSYPFLDLPANAPLRRRFGVTELSRAVAAEGVVQTIVVQAAPDPSETEELLALAAASPLIGAVVGWIDLAGRDAAEQLQRLISHRDARWLAGVRAMAQDAPDPDWLTSPAVRSAVALAGAAGLTCELLVRPAQLPAAVELAESLPAVAFVLDHCGKPAIASGPSSFAPWAREIRRLAQLPNVACKVSGLVTEARWDRWQPEQIVPYVAVAMEAFGPERLMFGSDWPVCLLAASYREVLDLTRATLGAAVATRSVVDEVLAGTARRIYRLPVPDAT